MSKLHVPRVIEKDQETPFALPEQVELPLRQLVGAVRQGLLAFSVGVGLEVMALMMEEELGEIVGPKGKHDPTRTATRHGSERGRTVLGGRKVSITRPRARYLDGSGEISSPPTPTSPRRTCSATWHSSAWSRGSRRATTEPGSSRSAQSTQPAPSVVSVAPLRRAHRDSLEGVDV